MSYKREKVWGTRSSTPGRVGMSTRMKENPCWGEGREVTSFAGHERPLTRAVEVRGRRFPGEYPGRNINHGRCRLWLSATGSPIFDPIRSPGRLRKCARRWPTLRSATMCTAKTHRSMPWKKSRRPSSAKPAAVFVPTGSMGNQLAIGTMTRPGDEVLCVEAAHVRNYEVAAAAAVSGVQFRTLPGPGGQMTAEEVAGAIAQSQYHMPRISLLVWENTHNVSGGTVVPFEMMTATTAAAREGRVVGAYRRGPDLQCRSCDRDPGSGVRGPGGHHPVLFLERSRGAGRLGSLWFPGPRRRSEVLTEAPGWGYAAGGGHRRTGPDRLAGPRPDRRRPRARSAVGRRSRRPLPGRGRPGRGPNQYGGRR